MTGAVVAKWPTNADRERQAYINAVLEWQRVYGCIRATAEAAVSQILGTQSPPIQLDEWSRQGRPKRGRPGSPAVTISQNVGILAHYHERAGVRPMQAIAFAKIALGTRRTLVKSKAVAAMRWAREVLSTSSDDELETHARAAWLALGGNGLDPLKRHKQPGRAPGRPPNSRFKGTNYRGI